MNNLSRAVEVAVCVRNYLLENTSAGTPNPKEFDETQQKILGQVKNITGLKDS